MLTLYTPSLDELWFRKELLNDEETMAYNHSYGGCIPFPPEKWENWYKRWLLNHENKRFYRYLLDEDNFIGEAAYHFDDEQAIYLADIIIHSKYRGRGYGSAGLQLLCEAAKNNGLAYLHDNIAIDNPGVNLFLKNGFTEEYRTKDFVMVKKALRLFHRFFDQEERRERFGGDCLEFQHCKFPQGTDIKTLLSLDSIKHWQDESLYISGDDWNLFIEHYGDIIIGGTYANGDCGPLDLCGINYFTAEQMAEIVRCLEEKQPFDYKALLLWLKETSDSNGFYVLGL